ncbi:MAG: thiamine diphosphokinase [Firmicutes bacterium]|nr:thiamine diphosphokinase [Bacillota bacterium]
MARAVIITSYLEYPVDIPALLAPEDYIVCLDGGYDIACAQGIRPHLWLGDFDSLQCSLPEEGAGGSMEIRRYPPEKDFTDLELSFRVLDPGKTPELLVIGGLGGRLDQTLINIQMLQRYTAVPAVSVPADSGQADPDPKYRRIEILDGHNRCFAIHGDEDAPQPDGPWIYTIPRETGCYLSLLPLTEECSGLTLRKVRYPLEEAALHRGASLSISNEFTDAPAELRLRRGCLLVVITRGNAADQL